MNQWNLYTTKEIRPRGWLRRQLEIQAEGLSGNLDKMWPDVRDSAWIGGDREGWERVPYWLDGFVPLAYLLENQDMIARAKKYMDAILAAQQEDGWICPCTKEERVTYDTWAVQLIAKVLAVYYECSRDARIPHALYRVLRNYYELLKSGEISLFAWGKHRWFEIFPAMELIYDMYGEPWLKELAEILHEQGADYGAFTELWENPKNHWKQETHIVNLGMMLKAEAVSCRLLGKSYTDEAERLREILDKYNGTVYESFTGDECLSGLSPIQGTELCAIVEQMYSYELLYAYTGDSKWAKRLEVLAFNALPATISEDMWTHQYVQLSNQMNCEKFRGNPIFGTNGKDAHIFGLEPNYGCCTANFNQGWPKFALSAFLHQGNTVRSGLMIPSELQADGLHITLDTDYPFENTMKYTVETEKDMTLQIRIPDFAENLRVNGQLRKTEDLSFDFAAGTCTEISIAFDVTPRFKARPYGLHTAAWGSLLFSVPVGYEKIMREYEKNGVVRQYPYCDYQLAPNTPWNYAFCSRDLAVQACGLGDYPFSETQPPVKVTAKVQKIQWGTEARYDQLCARLPKSLKPVSGEETVELIPYGCAKLRMTELPILE